MKALVKNIVTVVCFKSPFQTSQLDLWLWTCSPATTCHPWWIQHATLCSNASNVKLSLNLYKYAVQWVLDYPNPDYPYPDIWTLARIAMFSALAGKTRCSHWSFATGESKADVRMTFPNATTLFPCSTGFRSRFTTSKLAEWSRKRCSTL